MRGLRVLAAAAALVASCGSFSAGAATEPAPLAPYQLVRSLQLVQDRVAVGDHAALPMQRKLLELTDARLGNATDEDMADRRNVLAVFIYALSGGNPATVSTLLRRLSLDAHDKAIANAILSYVGGGVRTSTLALKDIKPLQEAPEIAGSLALVKGSVQALDDPRKALDDLDQARLLGPGTLVEEAALRRSVSLSVDLKDPERFMALSDEYVRSYIHSPYASQFADAFVNGVVALHDKIVLDDAVDIARFMSTEQRRVIFLRIARKSAIEGLDALAEFATEKAGDGGGADDPRVLLYSSLTNVAKAPAQTLAERLGRIDPTQLSAGDRSLLDAVKVVSNEITSVPEEPSTAPKMASAAPEEPSEKPVTPTTADPAVPITSAELAKSEQKRTEPAPPPPTPAAEGVASAKPVPDPDGADATLADGRQKLAEIDKILAEATK